MYFFWHTTKFTKAKQNNRKKGKCRDHESNPQAWVSTKVNYDTINVIFTFKLTLKEWNFGPNLNSWDDVIMIFVLKEMIVYSWCICILKRVSCQVYDGIFWGRVGLHGYERKSTRVWHFTSQTSSPSQSQLKISNMEDANQSFYEKKEETMVKHPRYKHFYIYLYKLSKQKVKKKKD